MNTGCYFTQQDHHHHDNIDEPPLNPAASFRIFSEFLERAGNFSERVKVLSNHKHHLPTLFIHADLDIRPNNAYAHPVPDKTLRRHFEILRDDQNIVPVMKYPLAPRCRGGYEFFVPESALIYLHRRDGSLGGTLGWDNFVIFDSYLALRNLSISQTHSTPETRKLDFQQAAGFIRNEIFRDYESRIPLDMQDLLRTLESYADSKKKLVAYHFATMSHSERINFMKNCSDKRKLIPSYENAIVAIKKMPTNINEEAEMWGKLMERSVFTEMVKCYKFKKVVKYDVGFESAYKSNGSAIRCCRNLATHLGDKNGVLKDRDIDIMVSSIFAPILV